MRVVLGPDAGRDAVADGRELSVGTAPGNQLVLTDPTVSRHHLAVRCSERGYWVRDLGSTNGILLGPYLVQCAAVTDGCELAIGDTRIAFELLDDELREPIASEPSWGNLLGGSVAMRRLFAIVPRIARAAASVLIEGETGTGKSVLARAIHDASARADGPFVVVDCSSIPPTLIESVLFGHDRGAFTGATVARPGAFELAHGGTVFLDEVGELPLELQSKLLRVLETREVQRIGASAPSALDVRFIAATNQDLRAMVNRGTCRADLYYRLAVVTLQVPPLRERKEDIPRLAAHFYGELAGGEHPPEALLRAFTRLEWPGNVRELRNAVERAVLFGDAAPGELRERADGAIVAAVAEAPGAHAAGEPPPALADPFDPKQSFCAAKERAVARWERWYVAQLLKHTRSNLSEAARVAQSDRSHLRKLVRKHLHGGGTGGSGGAAS